MKDNDAMGNCSFVRRARLTILLIAIALGSALSAPAPAWGQDPVERLRQALITRELDPNPKALDVQRKLVEWSIASMSTIAHYRRAYFLREWVYHGVVDKPNKAVDLEQYRTKIGESLITAVKKAAADADPERQVAVALFIAELADSDQPIERKVGKGKFARAFTKITLDLAEKEDPTVKQTALHAMGKITPDPDEVIPDLKRSLEKGPLDARRIAAYALINLVKNAHYLRQPDLLDDEPDKKNKRRNEELLTLEKAASTAAIGLADADERIRGYSLQTILESAQALTEYISNTGSAITIDKAGKPVVDPNLKSILATYQNLTPKALKAFYDPKLNVRLTAVGAVDQIGIARSKTLQSLQHLAPELRGDRPKLFKAFEVADPFAKIVLDEWKVITRLLDVRTKEEDVRLRRGAIDLLEHLGDQVDPAIHEISLALSDPDRMVRWTAARVIRNVSPKKVGKEAIGALANLVNDEDPEISTAASTALDALGPVAAVAIDAMDPTEREKTMDALKNAVSTGDVEMRKQAMTALVSIGGAAARHAIPSLIEAVADPDARVRRAAAETIGKLGPVASDALPVLRNALRDLDAEVRLNSAEAILSVSAKKAL